MKLGKIPLLNLAQFKGNNYQFGKKIGERQKNSIRFIINRIVIKDEVSKLSREALSRHENIFPEYINELKGIADGARVSFKKLFTFNCFEDLCGFKNKPERCTTIFYKDGEKAFIGHNEDEFAINYGRLILIKMSFPYKKISFMTLNYPGFLCGDTISLNSHGMIHIIDTQYPREKYKKGFARSFIGRALLESRSVNQSQKILSTVPNFDGLGVMIFSKKEKKCIFIETLNRRKTTIKLNDKRFYAHSTRYLSLKFKNIAQDPDPLAKFRTRKAKELSNDLSTPSFKNIKKILSYHLNNSFEICRHPIKNNPESSATLASVIINLKNLDFFVANGNPCINDYSKFRLQS